MFYLPYIQPILIILYDVFFLSETTYQTHTFTLLFSCNDLFCDWVKNVSIKPIYNLNSLTTDGVPYWIGRLGTGPGFPFGRREWTTCCGWNACLVDCTWGVVAFLNRAIVHNMYSTGERLLWGHPFSTRNVAFHLWWSLVRGINW